MAAIMDLAAWVLLLTGAVMMVIGAIGLVRLPDIFTRMHGASIIDTMGVGAVLVGLMLVDGFGPVSIKLILINVFILFTSPTATHALARAALNGGVRPQLAEPDDDPLPADGGGSADPLPDTNAPTPGDAPSKI